MVVTQNNKEHTVAYIRSSAIFANTGLNIYSSCNVVSDHLFDSRNQLSHIPAFLCKLHSLEVLILSNNRLVSVPEEISDLSALKELVSERTGSPNICTIF